MKKVILLYFIVLLNTRIYNIELHFPVIVKPNMACGIPSAHILSIINNYEELVNCKLISDDLLFVQQFHSHNNIQLKLYIIGNEVN